MFKFFPRTWIDTTAVFDFENYQLQEDPGGDFSKEGKQQRERESR